MDVRPRYTNGLIVLSAFVYKNSAFMKKKSLQWKDESASMDKQFLTPYLSSNLIGSCFYFCIVSTFNDTS